MRRVASLLVPASLVAFASTAQAEKTLPYDDGQPVPSGYHVEEQSRYEYAVFGGALIAIGAPLFAWGYVSHREGAEQAEREGYKEGGNPDVIGVPLMVGGAALVLAGAPCVAVGLTKKKVLVADVDVVPVVTPSFGGLSLSATF